MDKLTAERIATMGMEAILDVVLALLEGQRPTLLAGRDDAPHDFLWRLYTKVHPRDGVAMERALLRLLAGFVYEDGPQPSPKGADRLLLLIGRVFADESLRLRAQPVDCLLEIVRGSRRDLYRQIDSRNLHLRALQTLVAIGWKGSRKFWRKQYALGGADYATIVFAGIEEVRLRDAVAWCKKELAESPHEGAPLRALFLGLPWLVAKHGRKAVQRQVNKQYLMGALTHNQRAELRRFGKLLDLDIKSLRSGMLGELSRDVLEQLYRALQLVPTQHVKTRKNLRRDLQRQLLDLSYRSPSRLVRPTVEGDILLGLAQAAEASGRQWSRDWSVALRERLKIVVDTSVAPWDNVALGEALGLIERHIPLPVAEACEEFLKIVDW